MGYSAERMDEWLGPIDEAPEEVMNTYPTFLHPEGLEAVDSYTTLHGFVLPAEKTSRLEFAALRQMIMSGEMTLGSLPQHFLPTLQQLDRITVAPDTGCWELPLYRNGEDVYPPNSPLAGKPRARYGKLSVAGIEGDTAHITMCKIFRDDPEGLYRDHVCNNKACCWHRHIEPVTPGVNTQRGREYIKVAAGQLLLFNRQPGSA